jgi:lipid A disaccharide synthetase
MVVMQSRILTTIYIVSKLLQSKKQELRRVCALLKDAYEDLKLYRNDFKSVVQTATDTAKSRSYRKKNISQSQKL